MSLQETIERIAERFARGDLPSNEEEAKNQVINLILEDLGWDVHNKTGTKEVEYERPVGAGKGAKQEGRADIALMKISRGSRQCICIVEAKAPQKNLDDHIDQLVQYSFHEGTDICVLTNAKEWWLFLPREAGIARERLFTKIALSDDREQIVSELQQFLSKEAVLSGDAIERAKKRLAALKDADKLNTEFSKIWDQVLVDPKLVDLVGDLIYRELGLRPPPDHVSKLIAGEKVSHTATSHATPRSVSPKVVAPDLSSSQSKGRIQSPKPSYVILFGSKISVTTYRMVYTVVCEELLKSNGEGIFETVAANRPTRLRPKVSKNSRDLRSPCQIGNSQYWFDKDATAFHFLTSLLWLLPTVGYSETDLKVFDADGNQIVVSNDEVVLL